MRHQAMPAAILCLLLALISNTWAMPPDEARAWREDLHFMAREMERTHKNLYHTISREQFASAVAALDKRIPTLERHEVIVEMAKIVAAVGEATRTSTRHATRRSAFTRCRWRSRSSVTSSTSAPHTSHSGRWSARGCCASATVT